ncbi:MAG: hydrogenase [Desulfobacula sp. RIFOXYB2_FULL_45_6]|nr:MAG: hydrogenase [Desulfobacula sp. RIFOXYB2_FULL_45_6]
MTILQMDTILTLVLLSVLFSFGSSRLPRLIKLVAFQGIVVSMVPFLLGHDMTAGGIVFTLATIAIRGIIIPMSIYTAINRVEIKREVEPIIGYRASIVCGLMLIVTATYIGKNLNIPAIKDYTLLFPTAMALLVAGMFLLMSRRNAIAMVLGYITMENGIYLVGTTISVRARHIVEFGILLDILAGVMIMAIILQNIKQTFDDVDTAHLRSLKE